MPRVIDYADVLASLTAQGLQCNYPNGGSFGFGRSAGTHIRGWIGPADSTLRPAVVEMVRNVSEPYAANLAAAATRAWQRYLAGNVWVMPASHWAFELNDGSRQWMPGLLKEIGVDPGPLRGRNSAAAIEFSSAETREFGVFAQGLLEKLGQSDFTMAFAGRGTVCTLHHHKQLWWVTADPQVAEGLDIEMQPGLHTI